MHITLKCQSTIVICQYLLLYCKYSTLYFYNYKEASRRASKVSFTGGGGGSNKIACAVVSDDVMQIALALFFRERILL